MIKLSEILRSNGFDIDVFKGTVRMIRHTPQLSIKETKKTYKMFEDIIDKGYFEAYQSIQKEDIFNCDYIIVFIGIEGKKALFWNIYEICGKKDNPTPNLPEGFPEELATGEIQYDLKPLTGFEDLQRRLVIEWSSGAINWWINHFKDEKIVEVRPQGFFKDFPGYLDFTLSFKELEYLTQNVEANHTWRDKLSAVFGIYLILDTKTGKQYVGKASGNNGIWQRWNEYVTTGDGGDKLLEELLAKNGNAYKFNFQFTLLATLPGHLKPAEVIEYEDLYKKKLGSRVFGLNGN
jgi:hypothetical protein